MMSNIFFIIMHMHVVTFIEGRTIFHSIVFKPKIKKNNCHFVVLNSELHTLQILHYMANCTLYTTPLQILRYYWQTLINKRHILS